LYRPCTASFRGVSLRIGCLSILRTKRKDGLEPCWQDETYWDEAGTERTTVAVTASNSLATD
jgi:hypothetical protein